MQTCVLNSERSDCLRDGTVLLCTLVVVRPEGVQQSGLAVVDMAHDGDDWGSQHEALAVISDLCVIDHTRLNVKLHADQLDGLV